MLILTIKILAFVYIFIIIPIDLWFNIKKNDWLMVLVDVLVITIWALAVKELA